MSPVYRCPLHDLTFQTVTDPRPPNSPGMAPLDHPDCPLFDVGSITGVFDSAIEGRRIVTRSGNVSLVQVVTHSAGMGSTLNANVAAAIVIANRTAAATANSSPVRSSAGPAALIIRPSSLSTGWR